MGRSTSLAKTCFGELCSCISNRWVKRGVEKFGKTMKEASWLLIQGSNHYTVPWSPFSGWLIFLPSSFPPAGAASPPFLLVIWALCFGRKMLPTPSHQGCLGQWSLVTGGNVHGGERLVGKSSSPWTCVKPPLSLHTWEAWWMLTVWIQTMWTSWEGIGKCSHRQWGGFSMVPYTRWEHRGQTHEWRFFGCKWVWATVTGTAMASVTPPSHQPRTLILLSVMGNLTCKHSGLYAKVV